MTTLHDGRRLTAKGLILIASDFRQLAAYLQPLGANPRRRVLATWPGPVTWLLPARPETPWWLTGKHGTLAVRVTAHPLAAALCAAAGGALVSTSANPSGLRPARSALRVRRMFGNGVDFILHGATGGRRGPRPTADRRRWHRDVDEAGHGDRARHVQGDEGRGLVSRRDRGPRSL